MHRFLLAGLLAGCPADDTALTGDWADCDPIAFVKCANPFPSSYYLDEDSTSPTGWRVHLGAETLPYTQQGELSYQPSPAYWNELDGFSPLGGFVVDIPGMSTSNLPGHADIGASLDDSSNLVILDWETGERFPAWAELDYAGLSVEGNRTLYIHPALPLVNSKRYVVGLRNVVDASGATIPTSAGFAALRDGGETTDVNIENRRELYEDIFSRLDANGWSRGSVTIAWDVVVKSADSVGARVGFMRDDALSRVGNSGPPYEITDVVEYTVEENEHTWKRVYGQMTVPRYTEEDKSGTLLTRGDDGLPFYNGETTVPFTIIVPRTAQTDPRPLKLVQYGHGLLGGQDEVHGGYLAEVADRYGYVLFAVNWTGMDEGDTDTITLMILNDLGQFASIPEREQQGFVEFAASTWMMKGAMASDSAMMVGDIPLIDASEVYYYGNSQGAILGGAYVAISKDIERATLGVGGGPYSLLLPRSRDFVPFFGLFQSVYDDQRDLALWMILIQQLWDAGESAGFARQMVTEPLPGVSAKQVLMQDAIGDAQVTTLGAQTMARAYGASMPGTPVAEVWGLSTVESQSGGSALTEYDFGLPLVPQDDTPPEEGLDSHEDTRRAFAGQEQMAHFFATGEILNFCEGACFCAEGACDAPTE
jgi:hypothetical protein